MWEGFFGSSVEGTNEEVQGKEGWEVYKERGSENRKRHVRLTRFGGVKRLISARTLCLDLYSPSSQQAQPTLPQREHHPIKNPPIS